MSIQGWYYAEVGIITAIST